MSRLKAFSLKQAKLHTNVPRPSRPAAKTEGPEPMDLSYASAQKNKGSNVRCFRCGNMGHYARDVRHQYIKSQGRRGDTGYRHGRTKNARDQ
ncbi:LOW QUALITY PROTEIN: hypothetical protein PHMEG_00016432 [Phytophthora megakarya]|uniref:CCHC-type domain-containing protein n=1 Tax=Phytophthora megakarya TaxID=4795 RepID=A0A225W0E6_9STRA|nr:LOW QUALITY PROTEIN: hypothetical protein PHMEG_00016432 [Phytophthora megakarya]